MPDKVIEVPGLGNIAFPDTMSDEEIAGHIQKFAGGDKSLAGFGKNLITSGENFVSDLAGAVRHPIDTLSTTGKAITGGMQKGLEAVGFPKPIEQQLTGKSSTPEFDAITQHFSNRYGSFDKLAETMYQDPVGFLSDLSTVAGGAGAGLKLAKTGTAAKVAATVSEFTDPLRLAGKAAEATGVTKLVDKAADATKTHLAKGALRGGYQSNTDVPNLGAKVDNAAEAMVQGGIPFSPEGVKDIRQAIGDLQKEKLAREGAGTAFGKSVDPQSVLRALGDVRDKWERQMFPKNDLKQIDAVIADFRSRFTGPNKGPIDLEHAEALKTGTYQNNKYGGKPSHPLAATETAEKAGAHDIMLQLEQHIPELAELNAQEAKYLGLEDIMKGALTRYRNTGGFTGNLLRNVFSTRAGITDAVLTGLGFGVSHDPATAAIVGGTGVLLHGLLSDPMVKSRLAIAINKAQQANPGKYGAPSMANAMSRVQAYTDALKSQQ